LYKTSSTIPKLEYLGTFTGGNMSVGNYHFYFKRSDEDGNETDFIAESGLVSVFIGFGDPKSMHTGEANNNSYKTVNFSLSNLDTAYDYITVYYTHYTA
jgi:hypothetical protein